MASETLLEAMLRRHVFTSDGPVPEVLDGIFGGISRPDIGSLLAKLATSTSYVRAADDQNPTA